MQSSNQDQDLITGINVTPMVDVTLVLLIIFMVTARFITPSGLSLNLPKAATKEAGAMSSLKITMNAKGELYLIHNKIDETTLKADLTRRIQLNPDLHVTLAADDSLSYGVIVNILDIIKQSGVSKVGLASQQ